MVHVKWFNIRALYVEGSTCKRMLYDYNIIIMSLRKLVILPTSADLMQWQRKPSTVGGWGVLELSNPQNR